MWPKQGLASTFNENQAVREKVLTLRLHKERIIQGYKVDKKLLIIRIRELKKALTENIFYR